MYVTSDNVNLRSGAGTGNAVIGSFSSGTNAMTNAGPTQGNGYSWYNITIDGLTGWMVADFLAYGTDGRPDPRGGFAIGAYVRPIRSLNLRSGPGTDNAIIATYERINVATVLDGPQSGGAHLWYNVDMWDDGNVGWFAGELLELARFEPTGGRHRILDGPLNLRSSGSLGASVVTTLATGDIVVISDASFVTADGYTWMPVYLEDDPDVTGWIAQGFSEEI